MGVASFLAALVLSATSLTAHDPLNSKISWEREISPIFAARCIGCHSPGGRAPMPLTTYDEVRPWARAIREEVLARRMPKWPVVRGYGDFINDRSLSPFEIALITAWVDGGARATAPRGTPPLPQKPGSEGTKPPRATRAVSLPCSATALPAGEIVGLMPEVENGQSLRLDVTRNGLVEPLLWVKNFDAAFTDTYWLRTPVAATKPTRVTITPPARGACRITALLATQTAR